MARTTAASERGKVSVAEVAQDLGEVDAAERPDQQRDGERHAEEGGHGAPPAAGARRSGFGKRQRDEVEQLLQQRLDGLEAAVPGELVGELLADGVRALERRPAAVDRAPRSRSSTVSGSAAAGVVAASARPTSASSEAGSAAPLAAQPIEGREAALEPAAGGA